MAARAYDAVFAGYNSDATLASPPRLPMPLTTTHEVTPIDSRTISWDPPPDGVVLVELFAGLATGLAAALAQGIRIRRYIYVDADPVAQIAAQARVGQLLDHYPTLLPSDAVRGFQSTWPHDVTLIGAAAFAASGPVDMVIAGWECQGHSRAGEGRGLLDHRSALFFELVRLTNLLQAAQASSPAYIFENVYSGDDRRPAVRHDFQVVCQYLGHEFAFDAAQVGARAHRYRAYWTNLAPTVYLRAALSKIQRPGERTLDQICGTDRSPQPVLRPDRPPQYPCNIPGAARRALPTIVSYPGSYAFRNKGPGMIYDHQLQRLTEPTAEEKEQALGLPVHGTADSRLTPAARHVLLGRSMDVQAMEMILALCIHYNETVSYLPQHVVAQLAAFPIDEAAPLYEGGRQGPDQRLPVNRLQNSADRSPVSGYVMEVQPANPVGRAQFKHEFGVQLHRQSHLWQERQAPAESDSNVPRTGAVKVEKTWDIGEQLTATEQQRLRDLLDMHPNAFARSMEDLGRYKGAPMTIELTTTEPVYKRRHRLSKVEWELVEKRCQELLNAGLIEVSTSDFAAPTVMPAKKDAFGQYTDKRMCGDYRALNNVTRMDRYPMPTPEEIFDEVGEAKVFSILDLRQGFQQIVIQEDDRAKTAFWGASNLYQWRTMPFGLKNAPAKFQRVMDQVLAGLTFTRCYIDDILIFSRDFDEHLRHIEAVLRRLEEAGLRCHPGKCRFGTLTVPYLGHEITPNGLGVQQAKVDAIQRVPAPTDISRLRAFMGLAGYYRRFIANFSALSKPLNALLKKTQAWEWGPDQQQAFADLKQRLGTAPVLRRPDYTRRFLLKTDWSRLGMGACLVQADDEGHEYVIAYASRSNNAAEANYSSYEGECLAAVWAVVHFRPYLYGQSFTLVTDHQPLRWLMTNDKLTGKLARWALILQEYDFDVVHKAGTAHLDTDGISRNPAISSADDSGARQDGCTNQPDWESAGQVVVYLGLLSDGRPQTEDTSQAEAVFPQLGGDVWGDTQVMRYLQEGKLPEKGSAGDRYRVLQRAGRFRWTDQQQLMRIGLDQDGEAVVPRPEEREAIISNAHERLGHFGTRRTHDLLRHTYWWAGMQADVAAYVARCKACDRVRSSFTARHPVLHPLPIQGLFYRWSLDIAGELPLTKRGGRYILIMIEHLSKWVEAVVLSEKSSGSTAAAFLDRVLSRFGGCAEVLTDRGSEFQGEFQVHC